MKQSAAESVDRILNDEQVREILAEERFRLEIKNELAPKDSNSGDKGSKLWRFFNSPLGLLLVSSIVVAGLGRAYVDLQNELRERGEIRSEILKLAGEFDYRLTKALALTNNITNPSTTRQDRESNAVVLWWFVAGTQEYQPSLPEYKNVHWYGVVSRLKLLGFSGGYGSATEAILAMDSDLGDFKLDLDEHDKRMQVLFGYRDALTTYLDQ